jgi:recombinational DNA repair ATPase RecF
MIRIDAVRLEHFRGSKQLTLHMEGRNFAIQGANGTGKSCIVDAIEFALTGDITRLSGRGMGAVSVKAHAPHVDARDGSAESRVIVSATVVATGESFTIERSVSNAKSCRITPDNPENRDRVAVLSSHPEFALSRREILKYVITEPGERAKQVQSLLRLDGIDKVRASLTTVSNACKADLLAATRNADAAAANLRSSLQVTELTSDALLQAVNERRVLLMLPPIETLTADTSIKEGVTAASGAPAPVSKVLVRKDLDSLALLKSDDEQVSKSIDATRERLQRLASDPTLLAALRDRDFLTLGDSLIDDATCPFCDAEWEPAALRAHVAAKLAHAADAGRLRAEIKREASALVAAASDLARLARLCASYAERLLPQEDRTELLAWTDGLLRFASAFSGTENIAETIARLHSGWNEVPAAAEMLLARLKTTVDALPDASASDGAREYLIEGQVRLAAYRTARIDRARAETRAKLAAKVLSTYNERSTACLDAIYQAVEKDFSRYYAIVNHDDEAEFGATLRQSAGKLELEVDFHGRGHFPPAAYHSEGHQDGMGLCLYLALMKHLLGSGFTFAVLDDVLMSVDAEHRKEVCRLLASEFPDTQFIFTTHDRVWLQHMVAEGVVDKKSAAQFRGWSVADGPRIWDSADVWAEIDEDLANDNVPAAAAALRRYMEFATDSICMNLRASLERQPDATYDLGDLLPAAVGRFKKLLAQAKAAANSWNQKEVMAAVAQQEAAFDIAHARTQAEKWVINPSVHYTSWVNLTAAEFRDVASACRDLLERFECSSCHGSIAVSPHKGPPDGLRCACGTTNLNLQKRTAAHAA